MNVVLQNFILEVQNLVNLNGVNGKITAEELSENVGGVGIVHHTQPSVVSITNYVKQVKLIS